MKNSGNVNEMISLNDDKSVASDFFKSIIAQNTETTIMRSVCAKESLFAGELKFISLIISDRVTNFRVSERV